MGITLANNAHTTLSTDASSTDTTIYVEDIDSFPSLDVGDYFYLTLERTSGAMEIVKVTQINASSFTVVRGQENTIPISFSIGSRAELRITVQSLEDQFVDSVAVFDSRVDAVESIVADGDKGSITVSSLGTVWTLDDAVVTLAKMANLNQYELIGRTSASAGVPQAKATSADVWALLGAADDSAFRTELGLGTMATQNASAVAITGGTATFDNTGLHVLDTNGSHYLRIVPGSDLTNNRSLTITTGDIARSITLNADMTLTIFGASLVDDVDATTARTTLGLGTIATQAANSVSISGGTISGTTTGGANVTNTARDTSVQTKTLAEWLDFDDTTCVLGDATKFYYPDAFGPAGTGRIYRFNRVKIGGATLSSADSSPYTTSDYLEDNVPDSSSLAQFASLSAIGSLGIVGASRASDYRTWTGTSGGGVQGVSGYGINDDTTGHATVSGVYGMALRLSGALGTTEHELTAANAGSVVDVTPNSTLGSGGQTIALNLTAGLAGATANISAYQWYGTSITAKGRKGRVVHETALDTALGNGGAGVYDEVYIGQSMRWLNGSDTTTAELYGDAAGLKFFGAAFAPHASDGGALGTSTLMWSDLFLADGSVINWGNGDCTLTYSSASSGTLTFAGATGSYNFNGGSVTTGGNLRAGNATAITAGGSTTGLLLSSTSSFGVFCGSGAPSISAAKGSLYLRSDGSGTNDRMYVNTNGSTTWTAVVTVA